MQRAATRAATMASVSSKAQLREAQRATREARAIGRMLAGVARHLMELPLTVVVILLGELCVKILSSWREKRWQ